MNCLWRKKPDFSAIVVPSIRGSGYLDYTVETHASRSMKVMEEFRQKDMLCDLTIHVTNNDKNTVDFKVHKVVLASCSPYFRAMFTSSFKERHASEVTIQDLNPQVVGKLIDYAYTAHITVGKQCALHLLLAAMRYQVDDVAKACCDFLTKHLDASNVIGISRFAEDIGCPELLQHCWQYVNTHFSQVTKEEEFLSLTHCQVVALFTHNNLKVLCESEVYKACTDWVRGDLESRVQYLHALLNAVKIYALPPNFLKNVLKSCDILSKADSCKDLLWRIYDAIIQGNFPPAPKRGPQLIYVAGGYRQRSLSMMEAFDPIRNVWIKLADMETPCSGLGACTLLGLLYTVGGRNYSLPNNTESNLLCCYNPMTNQWSQRAPLNLPRNRVGVGVVDGCIYAVGGSQGFVHHNTVERWDPESNIWTFVRPMSVARLGAGVTACGGFLYVVGGYDGMRRWNTAEKYHPDTDTWHQLASMSSPRSGLGLVCVNSFLYAIGGYDGHVQLNSTERYDTVGNLWEPRAPMMHCRSAHGVAVHEGLIYVLGGFEHNDFLPNVERYCPQSDTWTSLTNMSVGRSGMGVAVTMEPCPGNLPQQEEEEEEGGTTCT
uniref:Kelch-like ECH-associated protein 1 n=1 Tax=Gouania willdenowi TaxID=441366 RepID=A0A8C5NG96_GOUWI